MYQTETSDSRGKSAQRRVIEEAKSKVTIVELAERLAGHEIRPQRQIRCLVLSHEDRTPSFSIDAEKDLWHCFGCLNGGDVVTLAALVWGHDRMDKAAAYLLMVFGHEIPPALKNRHRRWERQAPVRDEIENMRIRSLRRRLYCLFVPEIDAMPPEDRQSEAQQIWKETEVLARLLYNRRTSEGENT